MTKLHTVLFVIHFMVVPNTFLRTMFFVAEIRVRPHFRFESEIWNWKRKKAWFHMIHFDAKHQKSEAKTKVK